MPRCKKQHVKATLITVEGQVFTGTNETLVAVEICPRVAAGLHRNEGYHFCKEVCKQPGHAERIAVEAAQAAGATIEGASIFIEGHHQCCPDCGPLLALEGVTRIYFMPPPAKPNPPDWDEAPAWATHVTCDFDGTWWWMKGPARCTHEWLTNMGMLQFAGCDHTINPYWGVSCYARPV